MIVTIIFTTKLLFLNCINHYVFSEFISGWKLNIMDDAKNTVIRFFFNFILRMLLSCCYHFSTNGYLSLLFIL